MGDWKNNKRIQVAVGLAVVFLALRWLFSPTLQDAALAYNSPPLADGAVANPVAGLALFWPVIELGIAFLAGVGLWVLNIGDWAWSQIQVGRSSVPATADSISAASPDKVQRDLIQAIATNDVAARMKLEPMVRGPEAIGELTAAVAEGDFATAEKKLAELKKLAAQSEKSEAAK